MLVFADQTTWWYSEGFILASGVKYWWYSEGFILASGVKYWYKNL